MGRPALKREAAMYLMSHHRLSQRRACALLRHPRSTHYYRSVKDPQLALRQRMREIAQVRVRYGYRRIHVLLRREGWKHSRGKTYRLYTEERLQLRSKLPKRRKMVVQRNQRMQPAAPDDAWTMDFVADQLANGTRFRALTVVDVFTREALAIEVGQRLKGEDVVATLDRIMSTRGKPRFLFVDNVLNAIGEPRHGDSIRYRGAGAARPRQRSSSATSSLPRQQEAPTDHSGNKIRRGEACAVLNVLHTV